MSGKPKSGITHHYLRAPLFALAFRDRQELLAMTQGGDRALHLRRNVLAVSDALGLEVIEHLSRQLRDPQLGRE
jgi:hypothetical protein